MNTETTDPASIPERPEVAAGGPHDPENVDCRCLRCWNDASDEPPFSIPERPAEPLREALMGAVRQWESDANGATLIAAKNLRRCAADVRIALAQPGTPDPETMHREHERRWGDHHKAGMGPTCPDCADIRSAQQEHPGVPR